jgi:hypothetical protein
MKELRSGDECNDRTDGGEGAAAGYALTIAGCRRRPGGMERALAAAEYGG